jgi:Flp pilus assembly protein TadG
MRSLRNESGASLVIVLLLLPVLVLMSALVIDTANWFVHKRHLQTQADAAALAAGRDFQFPCGSGTTSPPDTQIIATAHQYDGTASGAYNAQVGTPAPVPASTYSSTANNVFSVVNGANFFNQTTPNDTDLTGDPCQDKAIDVKMTESNAPSFFNLAGLNFMNLIGAGYINAQARVSIKKLATSGHQLPLAVPSPTPKNVWVTFINEASGAPLAPPFALSSADGLTWSGTSATPVTFTTGVDRVGTVVAMSGTGTTAICGQTGVSCYDSGGNAQPTSPSNGTAYIRGWSGAGTPGVPAAAPIGPRVRTAFFGAGTSPCTDLAFTASSATCSVVLNAQVDWASGIKCSDAGLTLTVVTGGSSSTSPMACPGPAASSATGVWTSGSISVPRNAGPVKFSLAWNQTAGTQPIDDAAYNPKQGSGTCGTGNKACSGDFGQVQRIFSGAYDLGDADTSRSGSINFLEVSDSNGQVTSVEQCNTAPTTCTRTLSVTLSVLGLQNTQTINSPSIHLHLDGTQGDQSLSCGANNGQPDFQAAIADGCPSPPGPYAVNSGDLCPGTSPLTCVHSNPGQKQVADQINARIQCPGPIAAANHDRAAVLAAISSCSKTTCVNPNYWVKGANPPHTIADILGAQPPDPRIVQVFVVPTGSFQSNGSGTDLPIRAFASFYVTGYDGSPCNTSGTNATRGAYDADDAAGTGEIVGHFVAYVEPGTGGSGSGTCNPAQLGDCIAVLTK